MEESLQQPSPLRIVDSSATGGMMLTRAQVEFHAGQIKYGHAESVTDHADVLLAHDAEQRQTIEQQAIALNKALDDQYIPGVWSCTQCEFGLVSTYLYVNSGTTGPNTDTMPMCPNDGSLLRRVTWQERANSDGEYIERILKEKDAQATRIRECELEIEQIRSLLGCHRAYIQETIRDLQARTEDIPNIDRLRQLEAELEAYRKGGVTEELLRLHDGFIKVGKGCVLVREDDYAALNAEVARLNTAMASLKQSEMYWVDEAEKYSAEIVTLKGRIAVDEDSHL